MVGLFVRRNPAHSDYIHLSTFSAKMNALIWNTKFYFFDFKTNFVNVLISNIEWGQINGGVFP
jgi:hypothetical protein